MNGFRVECQQLGTARTETVARPGECRRIGHATKLHSLKSHNTHEDPRFGGPIPVTVGTFETKVRPLRGFRALPLGGGGGGGYHGGGVGGGVPTRDTRPYIRKPLLYTCCDVAPSRVKYSAALTESRSTMRHTALHVHPFQHDIQSPGLGTTGLFVLPQGLGCVRDPLAFRGPPFWGGMLKGCERTMVSCPPLF